MLIYSSEGRNDIVGGLYITKIWIKKFKSCEVCGIPTVWKIRSNFNKFYTRRLCWGHLTQEAKDIIGGISY